jgi:uncharacterized HAD superfamily protein
MKKAIISDLDYTLSIPKNRDIYDHDNCLNDKINLFIYNILSNVCTSSTSLLIVTGREQRFKNITIQFLEKNSIDYSKIFMRENGDSRSNEIVKKEIFMKEIKPKWDVIYAIDDNPNAAKMYNEDLGLNCLLVKNSQK